MCEEAWLLAGRLANLLHQHDITEGFMSDRQKVRDHDLLEGYGYDTTMCLCRDSAPEVPVHVWASKTRQRAL